MKIDGPKAAEIVQRALVMGADDAELFCAYSRNCTVEVKRGVRDFAAKSVDMGYGVRVVRGTRQGFSFSTDPSQYERCIERAIETALWTRADPFVGFPEPQAPGAVHVHDPKVEELAEKRLEEMAVTAERAAYAADRRITRTRRVSVTATSGARVIANSRGISLEQRHTSLSASVTVIASDGNDSQSGWDFQGGRFLRDVSPSSIGATAARHALMMLGARRLRPVKTCVLLDRAVAAGFLGVLAAALCADSVQKGKSLLAGKAGMRIISENVDVLDSPLIDGLIGSTPFDAEGVAARNKTPVRKGNLEAFLHSTYTARKEGVPSTGNAVRGGFSSPPSVGVTNLFIREAEGHPALSRDELLSCMRAGLYVTGAMGMHTVNPVSGEFSVGVTGLWVEDGAYAYPVKEATISGNVLDLLGNVLSCGNDLKFFGKIGSPSLLIGHLDISA